MIELKLSVQVSGFVAAIKSSPLYVNVRVCVPPLLGIVTVSN
jgi:hypothetical protein